MDYAKHEYVKTVLKQVRFHHDHAEIARELSEHIEDMLAYAGDDSDQDAMISEHMGDPAELGRALNRVHNPVIGWVWLVSKGILIAMIVLSLIPAFDIMASTGQTVLNLVQGYSDAGVHGEVVAVSACDADARLDDIHIHFEELVRYVDGTVAVHWYYWKTPFSSAVDWSLNLSNCFEDEYGTNYPGGSSQTGGLVTLCTDDLEDFSQTAEYFVVDYEYAGKKLLVEIPLAWKMVA